MSQIFFDTHTFVRTLTEAGFPEVQAEALMEATRYALQESYAAWAGGNWHVAETAGETCGSS